MSKDSGVVGKIYVVATPIGNLNDMSPRAVEVLQSVDLILAEDTRHSQPLLRHFLIQTRCQAFHEHNEKQMAEKLCERIAQGESMAIISDAGVPLISDPGFPLVKLAHEKNIAVVPVPGACAAISAISVSGLATDRFCFEGFLPAKRSARQKVLDNLSKETRTLIFYESPRRLVDTLEDMQQIFGDDRNVVLARELTKLFETVVKAPAAELLEFVKSDENQCKGEIVLLVEGKPEDDQEGQTVDLDKILSVLLDDLPLKQAVNLTTKITGLKRNLVYDRALALKK